MDNGPAQTTVEDEIQPDDSASNVTGATHTSTMWVKAAQERAAAEARADFLHQTIALEETIAEIEDEEEDARIRQHQYALRQQQDELEEERKRAERARRRRRAEISMREVRVMQEVTEARRKEEVMEKHMNRSVSTVSQSTTRRRSIASAVFP